MPSEYDFLLPYSRGLRRTRRALLVGTAFAAGVASTALIIALPLRSVTTGKVTTAEHSDKAVSSVTTSGPAADSRAGSSKATNRQKAAGNENAASTSPPTQQEQARQADRPAPVVTPEKPAKDQTNMAGSEAKPSAAPAPRPDLAQETTGLAGTSPQPTQPPPASAQAAPSTAPATSGPDPQEQSAALNNAGPAATSAEPATASQAAGDNGTPAAVADNNRRHTAQTREKPPSPHSETMVERSAGAGIGTSAAENRERDKARAERRAVRTAEKPPAASNEPDTAARRLRPNEPLRPVMEHRWPRAGTSLRQRTKGRQRRAAIGSRPGVNRLRRVAASGRRRERKNDRRNPSAGMRASSAPMRRGATRRRRSGSSRERARITDASSSTSTASDTSFCPSGRTATAPGDGPTVAAMLSQTRRPPGRDASFWSVRISSPTTMTTTIDPVLRARADESGWALVAFTTGCG